MKLQDQVVSLELAKRLKELGVKQESVFCWQGYLHSESKIELVVHEGDDYDEDYDHIAAFTVAELLSELQKVAGRDIVVALTDDNVADNLAQQLCTKLQDLKETAGFGPTH